MWHPIQKALAVNTLVHPSWPAHFLAIEGKMELRKTWVRIFGMEHKPRSRNNQKSWVGQNVGCEGRRTVSRA